MRTGYSQSEAEALVDRVLQTRRPLAEVPSGARGHVIGTIDAGDHWNIVIEWDLPRLTSVSWYDKFDVSSSMQLVSS